MGCGGSKPAPKPAPTWEPGRPNSSRSIDADTPAPADPKPPAPEPHRPASAKQQEQDPPPQFAAGESPERPNSAGTGSTERAVSAGTLKDLKDLDGGGDDADDFAWVTAALSASDDAPPAWAVAAAGDSDPASSAPTAEVTGGTASKLEVKVQVLLEGGWKDSQPEETLQVCQHMARREKQFQIKARGQMYDIILDGEDGLCWQVNKKTGKTRQMRIMDVDGSAGPGPDDDGPKRDTSYSKRPDAPLSPEILQQQEWGPQSKRGGASMHPLQCLKDNTHAQECFQMFQKNEEKLCGDWAVFYHSYSFAALIYELNAAVGAVLFRFRSQFATLPRILVHEFNTMFPQGPDAKKLMDLFNTKYAANKRDHHPEFRSVAVSVMCNLVATGPEACPPAVFIAGYSCKDLSFRGVLENLLESCYVPRGKVKKLADQIIALSEEHGLDVTQFGGKPCKSGMAGHLMQIFIKRSLVDQLCYPAKPYGPVDTDRLPLSAWMNGNKSTQIGQARIIAHPKYFMQANMVRCYVASADKTFHNNRAAFQEKLTGLLNVILGEPSLRLKAATGIYGGKLPAWWSDEDQRAKDKTRTSSSPAVAG